MGNLPRIANHEIDSDRIAQESKRQGSGMLGRRVAHWMVKDDWDQVDNAPAMQCAQMSSSIRVVISAQVLLGDGHNNMSSCRYCVSTRYSVLSPLYSELY